jgi:hypothetical protein
MRLDFALECALLCTALGCSVSPFHLAAELNADACPECEPAVEEPPAARPSLWERIELGAARVRRAVASGYGRVSEGIESAVDSEAMRTAVKPFLYACLIVGFFAPR